MLIPPAIGGQYTPNRVHSRFQIEACCAHILQMGIYGWMGTKGERSAPTIYWHHHVHYQWQRRSAEEVEKVKEEEEEVTRRPSIE